MNGYDDFFARFNNLTQSPNPINNVNSKANALRRAEQQKKIQLAELSDQDRQEANAALAMGIPADVILGQLNRRAQARNLTNQEREANYQATLQGNPNAIPDNEYAEARNNMSPAERHQLGLQDEAARQRALELGSNAEMASLTGNENGGTLASGARNLYLGAWRGAGMVADTAQRLGQMGQHAIGLDSDEEYARKLNSDTYGQQLSNLARKGQTSNYAAAEERVPFQEAVNENIAEQEQIFQSQLKDPETAKRISENVLNNLNFIDSFTGGEWFVEGVAEQVPLMLATMGGGYVGSKVTEKAITTAVQRSIKKRAAEVLGKNASKQAVDKFSKFMTAVVAGPKGGAAKLAKAKAVGSMVGAGAVETTMEGVQAGVGSFQQVMALPDETILNSPKYARLKEENPNASLEDIKIMMAEDALDYAFAATGVGTALVSALGGTHLERKLAGQLYKDPAKQATQSALGRVGNAAGRYVKDTVKEAGTEFVQEGGATLIGNMGVNYGVGDRVVNPEAGALSAGLQGAAIGGAMGGATQIPNAALRGAVAGVNAVNKGIQNRTNKIKQQTYQNQQEEINSIFGGPNVPPPDDSIDPSNPDNPNNPPNNNGGNINAAPPVTPSITGKAFEETSVGKAWNEVQKNENVITALQNRNIPTDNLAGLLNEVTSRINFMAKVLQSETDTEKQENILQEINALSSILQVFENAALEDISEHDSAIADIHQQNQKIQERISKFAEGNKEGDTSIESLQEALEINNQKLDAALERSDAVAEFQKSDIGKILFPNQEESENIITNPSEEFEELNSVTDILESSSDPNNKESKEDIVQKALSKIRNSVGTFKQEYNKKTSDRERKEYALQFVNSLVQTLQHLDSQNIGEILNILKETSDEFLNTTQAEGSLKSIFKTINSLSDRLNKDGNQRGVSEKQAKVILEKYIGTALKTDSEGSFEGNYGLLQYAVLHELGKLTGDNRKRFNHFVRTQASKANALAELLKEASKTETKDGKFKTPLKLKNAELSRKNEQGEKNTITREGNREVEFKSMPELRSYANAVMQENAFFNTVATQILNNESLFQPKKLPQETSSPNEYQGLVSSQNPVPAPIQYGNSEYNSVYFVNGESVDSNQGFGQTYLDSIEKESNEDNNNNNDNESVETEEEEIVETEEEESTEDEEIEEEEIIEPQDPLEQGETNEETEEVSTVVSNLLGSEKIVYKQKLESEKELANTRTIASASVKTKKLLATYEIYKRAENEESLENKNNKLKTYFENEADDNIKKEYKKFKATLDRQVRSSDARTEKPYHNEVTETNYPIVFALKKLIDTKNKFELPILSEDIEGNQNSNQEGNQEGNINTDTNTDIDTDTSQDEGQNEGNTSSTESYKTLKEDEIEEKEVEDTTPAFITFTDKGYELNELTFENLLRYLKGVKSAFSNADYKLHQKVLGSLYSVFNDDAIESYLKQGLEAGNTYESLIQDFVNTVEEYIQNNTEELSNPNLSRERKLELRNEINNQILKLFEDKGVNLSAEFTDAIAEIETTIQNNKELKQTIKDNIKAIKANVLASFFQLSDEFLKPFLAEDTVLQEYSVTFDTAKEAKAYYDSLSKKTKLSKFLGEYSPNSKTVRINIPEQYALELYLRGIDLDSPILVENGAFVDTPSFSLPEEILHKDITQGITDEELVKIGRYFGLLGPTESIDDLNRFDISNLAYSFIKTYQLVEKMFVTEDNKLPVALLPLDEHLKNLGSTRNRPYPAIATINALNQFIGYTDTKSENGAIVKSVTVDGKILKGLTDSVIFSIMSSGLFGTNNLKAFQDSLEKENVSDYRVVADNISAVFNEDFHQTARKVLPRGSAANIGLLQSDLQEELGRHFLDFIGYKWNKNVPEQTKASQARGIGFEIYGMLLNQGIIREFTVYKFNDSFITDKNLFNEEDPLHKTTPELHREFFSNQSLMKDPDNPKKQITKLQYLDRLIKQSDGRVTKAKYANFVWSTDTNNYFPDLGVINNRRHTPDYYLKEMFNNPSIEDSVIKRLEKSTDVNAPLLQSSLDWFFVRSYLTNRAAKKVYQEKLLEVTGVRLYSKADVLEGKNRPLNDKGSARAITQYEQNRNLSKALKVNNEMPYGINMPVFYDYSIQPEFVMAVAGASNFKKEAPLVSTERKLEADASREKMANRTFELFEILREEAREQGIEEKDIVLFIQNKITRNLRIMQSATVNPQSDKVMRSLLVALDKYFDEEGNMRKLNTPYIRIPYSENTRSITAYIDDVLGSDNITKDYSYRYSALLAVAQSLGIKIERKSPNSVLNELKILLEEDEVIKNSIINMAELVQGQSPEFNDNLVRSGNQLYDKYGTDAMRAYVALRFLATIKYANTGDNPLSEEGKAFAYTPNLYIEADGISNVFYNIVKQFNVTFSEETLTNLKRVGHLPIDVLAEIFDTSVGNTETDVEQLKELQKGFEYLTDISYGENTIKDSYETLSYNISQKFDRMMYATTSSYNTKENKLDRLDLDEIFESESYEAINEFFKYGDIEAYVRDENGKILEDDAGNRITRATAFSRISDEFYEETRTGNARSNLRKALILLVQLNALGAAEASPETEDLHKILTEHLFTTKPEVSKEDRGKLRIGGKNYRTLQLNISRSLAKLIGTPSGYGGELKGINSQVMTDLFPNLDAMINSINDRLIQAESPEEIEAVKEHAISIYKQLETLLIISDGTTISGADANKVNNVKEFMEEYIQKIEKKFEYNSDIDFEAIKRNIGRNLKPIFDEMENAINLNKDTLTESFMYGVSSFAHDLIQYQFKETFSLFKLAIATDSSKFYEFHDELERRIIEYTNKRNQKKGYNEGNYKRLLRLSEDELKEIIRGMQNLPIIASAFSNNEYLLDELVKVGVDIIKQERAHTDNGLHRASLNSNYTVRTAGKRSNSQTVLEYGFKEKGKPFTFALSSALYETIFQYTAAGASNLTSGAFPTETAIMTTGQRLLARNPKIKAGNANIFDGQDVSFAYREEAGTNLNKAAGIVHSQFNLMESFFHSFNRGTLVRTAELYNTNEEIRKLYDSMYSNLNEGISAYSEDITREQAKVMLLSTNLEIADLEYEKAFTEDFKKFSNLQSEIRIATSIRNRLENILRNHDFDKNPKLEFVFLAEEETIGETPDTPSIKRQVLKNIFLAPPTYKYNKVAENFREIVAKGHAKRVVETKYLPSITNQYGGSNTGYLYGAEGVIANPDNNIVVRYQKFFTAAQRGEYQNNGIVPYRGPYITEGNFRGNIAYSPRTQSRALADFLRYDPQIQEELAHQEKIAKDRLPINQAQTHSPVRIADTSSRLNKLPTFLENNTEGEVVTVGDMFQYYLNDSRRENSQAIAVGRVLKDIFKNLSPTYMSSPIITNIDEFINRAVEVFKNNHPDASQEDIKNYKAGVRNNFYEVNGKPKSIGGTFLEGVGIYLNPNLINDTDSGRKVLFEELIHSVDSAIAEKYYREKHNLPLDTEQLPKEIKYAYDQLEVLALQFANTLVNEPEYAEMLDAIRTKGAEAFNPDYAYNNSTSRAIASAANIIYAFVDAVALHESTGRERISTEQLFKIQHEAMMEFRANILTDSAMISKAAVTKSEISSNRPNKKFLDDILDWFKKFFDTARKAVLKTMRIKDYRTASSNQDSILVDVLASYQTIYTFNQQEENVVKNINNNAGNTYYDPLSKNPSNPKPTKQKFIRNSAMYVGQPKPEDYIANLNSNSNISPEHVERLSNLYTKYDEMVGKLIPFTRGSIADAIRNGYGTEINLLVNKDLRTALDNFKAEVSLTGLNIEPEEHAMFKNLVSVFKINESLLTPEVNLALGNILKTVIREDTSEPLKRVLETLNNSTDPIIRDNTVNILGALIITNEPLRQSVQDSIQNIPNNTKLKSAVERFTLSPLENELKGIELSVDALTTLASDAMNLKLKNKLTNEERERVHIENHRKAIRAHNIGRNIGNIAGSGKLATSIEGVFFGQQIHEDYSDYNSSIGDAVRNLIAAIEKKYGRPTLVTSFMRLWTQAEASTVDIYQYLGEKQSKMEQLRERVSVTIPQGIRNLYEDAPLTNEEEKALNEALLPTNLHRLLNLPQFANTDVQRILKSQSFRDMYIDRTKADLEEAISSLGFNPSINQRIFNYIIWQSKGLGELSVKRTAKAKNDFSNHILPNTKTIASLKHIDRVLKIQVNNEEVRDKLKPMVDLLTTLYSLEHVSDESLNTLHNLAIRHPDNFNYILQSGNVLEQSSNHHLDSYAGEDGFHHQAIDPKVDFRIIPKDRFTKQKEDELLGKGYELVELLPNGHKVYFNNMASSNRFTTGILGLTEATIQGVTIDDLRTLGSFSQNLTIEDNKSNTVPRLDIAFERVAAEAIRDEYYYDKLTKDSAVNLVVGHDGNINHRKAEVPRSIINKYAKVTQKGLDAIGNYQGRIMEEHVNIQDNRKYVYALNQKYRNRDRTSNKNWVKITPQGVVEVKNATDAYKKRIQDFYYRLPLDTRRYIKSIGGLYVEMSELDNIIGYNQASVTDIWNGKSPLPKEVQALVKGMFNIVSPFGFNPEKTAKYLETLLAESVHFTKDVILNRSLNVSAGNMLSNAMHLVLNHGIPTSVALKDMKDGMRYAKEYERNAREAVEVYQQLRHGNISPERRTRLRARYAALKELMDKNPVSEMVRQGIFTSVVAQDIGQDPNEFSLFGRIRDKYKIDAVNKAVPEGARKFVNNLLISEGSKAHEFMVSSIDYGDFVAKYALYKHLTTKKALDPKLAMNIIRDEFINYGMNRGVAFDWANRHGVHWFLAYSVGIQKVIFRNARKNPLRTLATYGTDKLIHTLYSDKLGLIKTVPSNNLLPFLDDDSITYNFGNAPFDTSSHWLHQLLL